MAIAARIQATPARFSEQKGTLMNRRQRRNRAIRARTSPGYPSGYRRRPVDQAESTRTVIPPAEGPDTPDRETA